MCSGRVRISSSGLLSILLPPSSALGPVMVISFIFCTGGAAVPVVVGGDWSLDGCIVAAALPLPRPTCCWAPSCSLTPPPPRGAGAWGMSPGRRVSTPPPPRDLPRPTPRPLPPPRVDILLLFLSKVDRPRRLLRERIQPFLKVPKHSLLSCHGSIWKLHKYQKRHKTESFSTGGEFFFPGECGHVLVIRWHYTHAPCDSPGKSAKCSHVGT